MFLKAVLGKSLSDWSDEDLVQAFTKRARNIYFDELFNRYHVRIYGYCLSRTAKREDSKDLTLSIFEQALTQLRTTPPQHFAAWLFALASNVCSAHILAIAQESQERDAWQHWQAPDFMPNEAFRRLIEAEELAKLEAFQQAMSNLYEPQRLCVQYFHIEGLSYQATAERTSYSLAQVKSYLQNGRRNLKTKLTDLKK